MSYRKNLTFLLGISDVFAWSLSFVLGQALRLDEFNGVVSSWWMGEGQYRVQVFLLTLTLMLVIFSNVKQHYSQRKPFWDELYDVLVIMLLLMVVDAAVMFLSKWQFSRIAFGVQWLSLFLLLPSFRLIIKTVLLRLGYWQIPVTLVGGGVNAKEAWLALKSESLMGYHLQELIMPPQATQVDMEGVSVLLWDAAFKNISQHKNHHWVIALEANEYLELEQITRHVLLHYRHVLIVPPTRGLPLLGMEPLHAFSHEVLLLRSRNNLQNNFAQFLKRSFDIVFSIILLVLLSPLFAYLIFKVRQSQGPAFFGHQRVGCQNQLFPCYKFRTMVTNSAQVLEELLRTDPVAKAEWEREFKLKNDPRITSIGDFLRRSSLDELPQLWNVLRGDMSLVGPRPVVQPELEKYGENVAYYLQVRPGMTGLWQVSGRNDVDYETRVALDAWYVRNWSLWNDIVILIKTVRAVLMRDGSY
ncbi:MAG: undecaprenyl-phosphate galactose phosphotransferase WbaP [Moraxellaceae bacterium]|nr:undecaprenyl-phosphate galactose phosphotransferase WbaP [Moraxellaceae bacterium]